MPKVIEKFGADLWMFEKRLHDKGWKLLGQGCFGAAYGKGDLVWKIERDTKKNRRSGWMDYIKAVAQGYFKGPHAPKVKLVLDFDDYAVAALMERCTGELWRSPHSGSADMIRMILERHSVRHYYSQLLNPVRRWKSLRRDTRAIPHSLFGYSKQLRDWEGAKVWWKDCHSGNIMVRRDGTLVVIDPFSGKMT